MIMECSNAWRRAKVWMIDKSWAWNACHYLLCVNKSNGFFLLARRIESTRDNVFFSLPGHSFSALAFDLTNRNVSHLEPDVWFGILRVSRVVSDGSKHRDRQVYLRESNWSSMISFLFSMSMLMIVYIVELLFFSIKPCRSFFLFPVLSFAFSLRCVFAPRMWNEEKTHTHTRILVDIRRASSHHMSLALTGCASSCVVLRLIIKFRGNSSRGRRKSKRASGVVFLHLALRLSSAADDRCFGHAVQDVYIFSPWQIRPFLSFLSLAYFARATHHLANNDCVRLRSLQLEIFTRRYLFVGNNNTTRRDTWHRIREKLIDQCLQLLISSS